MEQRERVFNYFLKATLTCACSFLGIVRLLGKLENFYPRIKCTVLKTREVGIWFMEMVLIPFIKYCV
jgi:hypothetical protein